MKALLEWDVGPNRFAQIQIHGDSKRANGGSKNRSQRLCLLTPYG